jgi:glycosyltransferase involved in cell wall biosynthesis
MPLAYNAAKTLPQTCQEIPRTIVDEIILVDDDSPGGTVALARELGLVIFGHERNLGCGRSQKACYREALKLGGDIIVMLHPDYQYSPKLVAAMAAMIASGEYDVVLGSRILGAGALAGGMPVYKYVSNRVLTAVQNLLLNYKLSEYHTGYRAFARHVLCTLPLEEDSDDFVFDNQMLVQVIFAGHRMNELSCPTRYFPEASSINFLRSVRYGLGVLVTSLQFRLQRLRLARFRVFDSNGARLSADRHESMPTHLPRETRAGLVPVPSVSTTRLDGTLRDNRPVVVPPACRPRERGVCRRFPAC